MSVSRGRFLISLVQRIPRGYINAPNCTHRSLITAPTLCNKAVASFDEVKAVQNLQNPTVLIDVREPQELQETGVIPGSINIPVGEVESVLKDSSPEEFLKKYGRPKPTPSTEIVFSCKSGVRSGNAQDIALKLGFKNVKNYEGGWLDWEEKIKNR